MSDLISRQALCEYALNQKDTSITPNDIMRFPSAHDVHSGRGDIYLCTVSPEEVREHKYDFYCGYADRRTD